MRRLYLLSVLLMVVALPVAANAHYKYERAIMWENADGDKCFINRAEVSHGRNDTGYMSARGTAVSDSVPPWECRERWVRPPGYLRVKFHWLKWVTGYGWAQCYDSDFRKNRSSVSEIEIIHHEPSGGPTCGYGKYGTLSRTHVKYNGKWRGRRIFSRGHYLPVGDSLTSSEMDDDSLTPAPAWADDASKYPAEGIPQLDSKGKIVGWITLAEFNSEAESTTGTRTLLNGGTLERIEIP